MNNRGQSLVIFVMIMPIILMLIITVSDLGNLMVEQNKYQADIKSAIKYGLKHKNEENLDSKIQELLDYNIKENKDITVAENNIEIRVLKKNRILSFSFDSDMDYIGYIQDEKIIIDRR